MRTVCFVVSLFRRSLSSCHSLYGIELASEGTSVFFSLMGVFSSSSIPSTKTPAHNALQRTKGSSFPCNEPKEKKMSQNWSFGNLSKNVGVVEIHKILARLTNAEKDLQPKATAGLVQLHSLFCKRCLLKKVDQWCRNSKDT